MFGLVRLQVMTSKLNDYTEKTKKSNTFNGN